MLHRSTIQLLRFHFSFFLLPIYLFALSQVPIVNWNKAALVFFILHLLVYPSSNGYNSYMDRDDTPIGGLQAPLQPTRQLYYVSLFMDALALLLSAWVSLFFAAGLMLYILASRAYSYRGIRLKRFALAGFATVFVFQGAVVYLITHESVSVGAVAPSPLAIALAALLIGALYPLTQVYQHEADKKDGVITISYRLGKRGTFLFSGALFALAAVGMAALFKLQGKDNQFFLFLLFLLPVVLFFLYWMSRVWRNEAAADFKNSLRMNMLATLCTTAFFITLIILNH